MTEVQIFQVFGLFFLAIGLGMLINLSFYEGMFRSLLESAPVFFLMGMINLIVGFLFVTFHNTWVGGWSVVITLIGWIAFIKGLVILILPNVQKSIAKSFVDKKGMFVVEGIIVLILGLIFGYLGYFA